MNWTQDQQNAIDLRKSSLLISAAAGSGKTATLTERIIRRICDEQSPADIGRMLIVTFTRSAALQLRTKITSALNSALAAQPSNRHLITQLARLDDAKICTIDSFFYDMLRENAIAVGLPTSMRITDTKKLAFIARKVCDRLGDEFYRDYPDFPTLVESLTSTKSAAHLSTVLFEIYQEFSKLPEDIHILERHIRTTKEQLALPFFKRDYGVILKNDLVERFDFFLSVLDNAKHCFTLGDEKIEKKYGEVYRADLDFCLRIRNMLSDDETSPEALVAALDSYEKCDIGRHKLSSPPFELAMLKQLHSKLLKKTISDITRIFFTESLTIDEAVEQSVGLMSVLYEYLKVFKERFDEEKQRVGVMSFDDVRRYVFNLLLTPEGEPSAIAKQIADMYTDVFIDEYQDVDDMQDMIFRAISKPDNLFLVGDIKQSIYEFRGAVPDLFASYRQKYPIYDPTSPLKSDFVSIFMSENFRCDQSIINFSNLVCAPLFKLGLPSIGYSVRDDLKFAKSTPQNYVSPPVKLCLLSKPKNNEADIDPEAEYVAQEILRLIKDEHLSDGSPIRPKDIAVLYRSRTGCEAFCDAFDRFGIPYSSVEPSNLLDSPDVKILLCVLNSVDNPHRDIYLAGALCSPLFCFSADELLIIRELCERSCSLYQCLCRYAEEKSDELAKKCLAFKTTLEKWQDMSLSLPIDRFIRMLFDTQEFISSGLVCHRSDNGEGGDLLAFYDEARSFESGGFKGLYQFVSHIRDMIESNSPMPAPALDDSDNSVKMMTMHQSKGLEFPVCFIIKANESMESGRGRGYTLDRDLGLSLSIPVRNGIGRTSTPIANAIAKNKDDRERRESVRILYVALTRAKERLYVSAILPDTYSEEIIEYGRTYPSPFFVLSCCSSFLHWILLSCPEGNNEVYSFEFLNASDIQSNTDNEHGDKEDGLIDSAAPNSGSDICEDTQLLARLTEAFAFEYPYKTLGQIPSKLSVSELSPSLLDLDSKAASFPLSSRPAPVPPSLLRKNAGSDPVQSAAPAKRGTDTHLFLQFCSFENARKNGAEAELSRLIDREFLAADCKASVYLDELERFLESEMMQRISSAARIIREQRFNVFLPADELCTDPKIADAVLGESLAVQGVVDLILIDAEGNIELYDYKTDRLSREELADPAIARAKMQREHALQLSYYAKAIRLLFGKECSRTAIYSTHSARLYDLDL